MVRWQPTRSRPWRALWRSQTSSAGTGQAGRVEGIEEPVPRALHVVLRRAVLDHAVAERRRAYPPLLHVGRPGGPAEVFAIRPDDDLDHHDETVLDHAVRCDVVAASRTPVASVRVGADGVADPAR